MIANNFQNKFKKIKEFIYTKGRLIDRLLFSLFFEDGDKMQFLTALRSYQNSDGGFGNGIEPDLLCPHSSAIGAETALFYLDLLNSTPPDIMKPLKRWVFNSINERGYLIHPFKQLFEYPHQKWWENSDNERILVIAAFFEKFGIENKEFFQKVESYFTKLDPIGELTYYDYPKYLFLKHLGNNIDHQQKYNDLLKQIPAFLKKNEIHYPIWSRYWYHLISDLNQNILDESANKFIKDIDETGGIPNPYENLFWWKPIFTLDGLILLRLKQFI